MLHSWKNNYGTYMGVVVCEGVNVGIYDSTHGESAIETMQYPPDTRRIQKFGFNYNSEYIIMMNKNPTLFLSLTLTCTSTPPVGTMPTPKALLNPHS